MSKPTLDIPWPEDPKRRSREEILDAVERRAAVFGEDLLFASEPYPGEHWSERRQKVWRDSQLSAKDAPVYLKLNHGIAAAMVKGRNQQPVAQFNVLVLGDGTLPADEWRKRAAELERQDAIDVQALPPMPAKGGT